MGAIKFVVPPCRDLHSNPVSSRWVSSSYNIACIFVSRLRSIGLCLKASPSFYPVMYSIPWCETSYNAHPKKGIKGFPHPPPYRAIGTECYRRVSPKKRTHPCIHGRIDYLNRQAIAVEVMDA